MSQTTDAGRNSLATTAGLTPAIRASRILKAMANYESSSGKDEAISPLALGSRLGRYESTRTGSSPIDIYEQGLSWRLRAANLEFRYDDIEKAFLPYEKGSDTIAIRTRSGLLAYLPRMESRGSFRDAMEMLRFLDRVVGDIRAQQ